ncbi:MAG: CCA tRNA nucleotidyltransferase [Clostridia bacterium]
MAMKIFVPLVIKRLASLIQEENFFMVGGMVRDALLNKTSEDMDICSPLLPKEIEERLKKNNIIVKLQSEKMGTVKIFFEDKVFEHTTFRTDQYSSSGSHEPVQTNFVNDIEIDAERRDFTINALYASCQTGEVFDFFGGLNDLVNKRIVAVGEKNKTFLDDPLRILRLARFSACLKFSIDKNTFESAKNCAYRLQKISSTRIWQEISKTLCFGKEAIFKFFEIIKDLGATKEIWGVEPNLKNFWKRKEKCEKKPCEEQLIIPLFLLSIAKEKRVSSRKIFEAVPNKNAKKMIEAILNYYNSNDVFNFFDDCDNLQEETIELLKIDCPFKGEFAQTRWKKALEKGCWVSKNKLAIGGNDISSNFPYIQKEKYAILMLNLRRSVFEGRIKNTTNDLFEEIKRVYSD